MVRIAVIDKDLCKPHRCRLECVRFCPINRAGKKAIELDESGKPVIFEDVCVGCGICVRKCPFESVEIVNLPDELEKETVHRYGVNGFKLYKLPLPRRGKIVGIIGKNGTGKTTTLRILAGELTPNLGDVEGAADWDRVVAKFRGSVLHDYFRSLVDGRMRVVHKVQHVGLVPKYVKGSLGKLLERADERGVSKELAKELGIGDLWDRDVRSLSGGELQKLLIVAVISKDADVYLFDEPSSYLDVKERVKVAKIIRSYVRRDSYVFVVEHDLAVLDYLSDDVCIIYGEPGVFGVVSKPYPTRAGINHFLNGYLPAENMRIRREQIRFHALPHKREILSDSTCLEWDNLAVSLGDFTLKVGAGEVRRGEVIGILGPNGIGKTTFVRALAGEVKPLAGNIKAPAKLRISYKPQYITNESFEGSVKDVLKEANPSMLVAGSWLYVELVRRLGLHKLLDRDARDLSGGELQKLAVASSLGREADLYLVDEPSAYLDVEERLAVAKVIRRVVEARGAAAFVVEHDVSIQDYVSDRLMVFTGEPGFRGSASPPVNLREGMNRFLKEVGVTFRRDPETGRPRVNKEGSYLDRLQRRLGEYYYVG